MGPQSHGTKVNFLSVEKKKEKKKVKNFGFGVSATRWLRPKN